ncbi:MAG: hypothetical protein JJU36_08035 [Phycisphaeraceae bacterium]|nr:hypothetical protein [Phycisphaeraceae bacterium]
MNTETVIHQLSRGRGPAVHRYYDVAVEVPGGGRILYFEFDRDGIPGPGQVIVADADGKNPIVVGKARSAIGHVGASAAWIDREHVAFSPDGIRDPLTVIHTLEGVEAGRIEGGLRSFSSESGLGLLTRVMGGRTGGRSVGDQSLELWKPGTGGKSTLLTAEAALALHPWQDRVPVEHTNLMNAKWSPDARRWFVVFTTEVYLRTRQDSQTPYVKALYVGDLDGSPVRYLCEFSHHPMWTPDGRGIIAYVRAGSSQDLVRFDLDNGQGRVLLADVPGVHASLDRSGQRLVTDIHDPDRQRANVVLIDLSTNTSTVLAEGRHDRFDHRTGTHPHPQWSRDEQRIFFNMADTGQPQLYAAQVPERA